MSQGGLEARRSLRRRGLISKTAYEQHFATRTAAASRSAILLQPLALLTALLGDFGAVVQELQSGGGGGPFLAAVLLHAAYYITVVVLDAAGVIEF